MLKKALLIMLLGIALTFSLAAEDNNDRISLDIQVTVYSSTNGTVDVGYKDSNGNIAHNHTQQFQINYGENILNYQVDIWPGVNPDPHIVFADGENDDGYTDYDEQVTNGSSVYYLELNLGLGHTDPTIPGNN
jgi:hypothetical protein